MISGRTSAFVSNEKEKLLMLFTPPSCKRVSFPEKLSGECSYVYSGVTPRIGKLLCPAVEGFIPLQ